MENLCMPMIREKKRQHKIPTPKRPLVEKKCLAFFVQCWNSLLKEEFMIYFIVHEQHFASKICKCDKVDAGNRRQKKLPNN